MPVFRRVGGFAARAFNQLKNSRAGISTVI
jgi:hypothetical protein